MTTDHHPSPPAPLNELGFYTLAGQPSSSRDLIDEIRLAEQLGLGSAFISERFDKKEAAVLSGAAELTVFRIVQEALTNAMKHAESAHSVTISLAFNSPEVRVLVVDDGRPTVDGRAIGAPALGESRNGGGHGVLGMAERAAAFDGSLVAGPRAEGGWQVAVTLRGCKAPALL